MLAALRQTAKRPAWLAYYGAILVAWAALYAMRLPPDLLAASTAYGPEFWVALCRVEPGLAGYPTVLAMWALMVAAMMAPGLVPALTTYDDLTKGSGYWPFLAGYGIVWMAASVVAAILQIGFAGLGWITGEGIALRPWFPAALLTLAGAYQFTPLKQSCLSKCRAPLAFFLTHWREGPGVGVALGLRHGTDCLGCCWALMTLAFVGGGVSLAFMGLATVLMAVEKLPDIGRHVTRPLGFALLLAAGMVGISAL